MSQSYICDFNIDFETKKSIFVDLQQHIPKTFNFFTNNEYEDNSLKFNEIEMSITVPFKEAIIKEPTIIKTRKYYAQKYTPIWITEYETEDLDTTTTRKMNKFQNYISTENDLVNIKNVIFRIDDDKYCNTKFKIFQQTTKYEGVDVKCTASYESKYFELFTLPRDCVDVRKIEGWYFNVDVNDITYLIRVVFRNKDEKYQMNVECEMNIDVKSFYKIFHVFFIYYSFQYNFFNGEICGLMNDNKLFVESIDYDYFSDEEKDIFDSLTLVQIDEEYEQITDMDETMDCKFSQFMNFIGLNIYSMLTVNVQKDNIIKIAKNTFDLLTEKIDDYTKNNNICPLYEFSFDDNDLDASNDLNDDNLEDHSINHSNNDTNEMNELNEKNESNEYKEIVNYDDLELKNDKKKLTKEKQFNEYIDDSKKKLKRNHNNGTVLKSKQQKIKKQI